MKGLIFGALGGLVSGAIKQFIGNKKAQEAKRRVAEESRRATEQVLRQREQLVVQGSRFSSSSSYVSNTYAHAQQMLNDISAAESRARKEINLEIGGALSFFSRLLVPAFQGAALGVGGKGEAIKQIKTLFNSKGTKIKDAILQNTSVLPSKSWGTEFLRSDPFVFNVASNYTNSIKYGLGSQFAGNLQGFRGGNEFILNNNPFVFNV